MTTTNTNKFEIDYNEFMARIDEQIAECDKYINAQFAVSRNRIVATEDADYQIGVDENGKVVVLIGDSTKPRWMSKAAAENLLYEQGFKASNGFGELKFKIWHWKDFYKQRKNNLEEARESIQLLMA